MKSKIHIFCPEYVPLKNKGEEAIIRGVADVLFPEGNCDIHILDIEADEYTYHDGIHVYPSKWFISSWMNGEFGLGLSWEKTRGSAQSLLRNGLHKLWPSWVKIKCAPLNMTASQMKNLASGRPPVDEKERRLSQLLACDYIVAGHDGGLNERVCHIIDIMRDFGIPCGIFGLELSAPFKSRAIAEIHHDTLRHCHFFYCRTLATVQNIKSYFPEIQAELLPDPAFGMQPAQDDIIDNIINDEGLTSFFNKKVVMCTCCEPAPIARYCFENIKQPGAKLDAHRQLFAELIQYIVKNYNVNVLFLPHAMGPGKALDDRLIANDILKRANLPSERARLLTTECSARILKSFLKKAELLVAERIHSLIGATGVHTPFLCMGSNTDKRIHGIIINMLGMENEVYFLNRPSLTELKVKFNDIWERRAELKKHLIDKATKNKTDLDEAANIMRKLIEDHNKRR